MGFPNPDPETYKAPWAQTADIRLRRAVLWLQSAKEQWDSDFPAPALADLGRARACFGSLLKYIDDIIEEDARSS